MERYYAVTIAVPEFTDPSSPVTQVVTLENALLVDVEVSVPSGHGGFTGVRVRQSRQQVLPWGNNSWIIADNYTKTFAFDAEIGANSISVQAYNNDTFGHSFYLRFHVREFTDIQVSSPSQNVAPLITALDAEQFPLLGV